MLNILTILLPALYLLLLLRQSLLLLRPVCDRPDRRFSAIRPGYIQRIEQHGSGAALAALPLLGLLLSQPELPAVLLQHKIWLGAAIFWAVLSLAALTATRFQHFNSMAFSSRDAGPADFGRRWPYWPDGVLWLCEMFYLFLLYTALELLAAQLQPEPRFFRPLSVTLGLLMLWVYWSNWQYRKRQGHNACVVALQKISHDVQGGELYSLRLRLEAAQFGRRIPSPKPPDSINAVDTVSKDIPINIPINIPMGFCMLHFPGLPLPRKQQNEHPLSLLSWHQESEGNIEMEFALEMHGFLQYLRPQELARRNTPGNVRLWGPYYDVRPQFFDRVSQQGLLLYIGNQSGLSPLLQYLQHLHELQATGTNSCPLKIAVLHLVMSNKKTNLTNPADRGCPGRPGNRTEQTDHAPETAQEFWRNRLEQAAGQPPTGVQLQVQQLDLPPRLSEQLRSEQADFGETARAASSAGLSRRVRRRLDAWQNYHAEHESELLQQAVRQHLADICRQQQWALSPRELRQYTLYRGPHTLGKLLEQCFDSASFR
ncbi:hypothetical protein P0082_04050 [Candidatus Haliotispira prima]|uniref:Uncharacterized protein n=1 Tax=Candidatus Haliotispira prima TaxID=3034016 RepID=A0ABY8MJ49_9SPIO|nr:hypothetical protein P0082_04050 [Candidatus Haliotispira prima]